MTTAAAELSPALPSTSAAAAGGAQAQMLALMPARLCRAAAFAAAARVQVLSLTPARLFRAAAAPQLRALSLMPVHRCRLAAGPAAAERAAPHPQTASANNNIISPVSGALFADMCT